MSDTQIYGGIEAGGTKFICATGSGSGDILARTEIKTTDPTETIEQVITFFKAQPKLSRVGIGSFGPVDINTYSKNYGTILNTPKAGWAGINILREIERQLDVPVRLKTDTDVAAIGEHYHGKGGNKNSFIYLTIGTGIGGSIFMNGNVLHGISHSEMGHMQLPQLQRIGPAIKNCCELHESCFEGYASGKSLEINNGLKAEQITDAKVWDTEAMFIALGIMNLLMILPVELVIIGGSVVKHEGLIDLIRSKLASVANSYIDLPDIDSYIVHASSDTIGVLGSIKLAEM